MKPTPERVKALSEYFNGISDEALLLVIDDAYWDVVNTYGIVDPVMQERLTRYLAAHFLMLSVEEVSATKEGDTSVSYRSKSVGSGLLGTLFGQEFERLLGLFIKKPLGLIVL